ncbi:ABC transporter ATP-binding protein/permease, partial [Candidatus Pelagibacter sp.]|nr:ABC transporter ATP-binding protein/permease [Candidatus Pelagibacter sp.]
NKTTLDLILNSNWNFFSEIDYGYLTNTFVKEITKIGDLIGQLARMFAAMTQFCIYLTVPLFINYQLTLTILFLILILAIPIIKISGSLGLKFGRENTQTANFMMSSLGEILNSLKFIFINSQTLFFKKDFLKKFDSHVDATLKSQILSTSVNSFFQPIGVIIIILVFGLFISRGIILSEVAAIFYSLISIVSATNILVGINININNFIPSIDQLNSILDKSKKFQKKNGELVFHGLRENIEFKDLNFSYVNKEKIIKGLNLEIKKNSITSIIGSSGAGKSTLLDLFIGLLDLKEGEIYIDGINLNEFDINSLKEKIGYVTQETTLFNSSIINNLKYVSSKNFEENEIRNSLKFANLLEFVENLPEGLNSIVGERGVQLSGGQRQRLSLARAFLKKPNILILDEATSSLDSITEQEIQNTIFKLKKNEDITIIVVAHRLSTIKNSDQIFVMDRGKVLEKGSYQELLEKKDSKFNLMLKSQIIS